MDLTKPIDLYCERLDAGLWAEPVNLLSNLFFIAAGLWGVNEIRRARAGGFAESLGWWVVAIGIGSALFHSFANGLTMWADILPIATFSLAYTLFNLRRYMDLSWGASLAIFFVFYAVVGSAAAMVPDWLREASNGSTGYIPPFLALIFFGVLVIRRGNMAGWHNIIAACIFVGSITFRMVDPLACESLSVGTHFLWHTLNAAMLAVLLHGVALYGAPQRN